MGTEAKTVIVDKEALIQALIELERHREIQMHILWESVEQLKALAEKIERTITTARLIQPQATFLDLLFSDEDLDRIFSDERIDAWETEFERDYAERKT